MNNYEIQLKKIAKERRGKITKLLSSEYQTTNAITKKGAASGCYKNRDTYEKELIRMMNEGLIDRFYLKGLSNTQTSWRLTQ